MLARPQHPAAVEPPCIGDHMTGAVAWMDRHPRPAGAGESGDARDTRGHESFRGDLHRKNCGKAPPPPHVTCPGDSEGGDDHSPRRNAVPSPATRCRWRWHVPNHQPTTACHWIFGVVSVRNSTALRIARQRVPWAAPSTCLRKGYAGARNRSEAMMGLRTVDDVECLPDRKWVCRDNQPGDAARRARSLRYEGAGGSRPVQL